MNMKTKSILGAAVALTSLTMSFAANAVVALPLANSDYEATLYNNGNSFILNSEYYPLTSGQYAGDYAYVYQFSGAPSALSSLSVYLPTGASSYVFDIGANSFTAPGALASTGVNSSDVYWVFSPNATGATLTFVSALPATFGDASAQDGGLWGNGAGSDAYGVVVPNVAPVPEPTTIFSGAVLLLPFGSSVLRQLRKKFQS
jgi:hypothetical protein